MPTKIEWVARPGTTPETWNPVTGCTKISPGCKNCYAERMAKRLAGRFGYPADEPFRVTLHPDRLEKPLKWRKPRTVFVCSMGDLFHSDVPIGFIHNVWAMMTGKSQHTFLILTKRPERMSVFVTMWTDDVRFVNSMSSDWVPENIWLGVTAENQATADERIPLLLQTPAAVRFVSCEPLLGSVTLYQRWVGPESVGRELWAKERDIIGPFLDWVIAGTESGSKHRPAELDWFRDLRDQCQAADVPFFLKQAEVNGKVTKLPELDGRQWIEWPK